MCISLTQLHHASLLWLKVFAPAYTQLSCLCLIHLCNCIQCTCTIDSSQQHLLPCAGIQHRRLDKTPNDYIAWRYASGEDREAEEKASAQVCVYLALNQNRELLHDFDLHLVVYALRFQRL